MNVTAFDIAKRFVGIKELPGMNSNSDFIMWCLRLVLPSAMNDETPWCSAFVNAICFILGLPMSRSAAARSWLNVGTPVDLADARVGFDVVIFKRGKDQPGPEVIDAPGHVAFFVKLEGATLLVLGGNQGDSISIARYPVSNVLGVRRLA